jgi:hypothetical protein
VSVNSTVPVSVAVSSSDVLSPTLAATASCSDGGHRRSPHQEQKRINHVVMMSASATSSPVKARGTFIFGKLSNVNWLQHMYPIDNILHANLVNKEGVVATSHYLPSRRPRSARRVRSPEEKHSDHAKPRKQERKISGSISNRSVEIAMRNLRCGSSNHLQCRLSACSYCWWCPNPLTLPGAETRRDSILAVQWFWRPTSTQSADIFLLISKGRSSTTEEW